MAMDVLSATELTMQSLLTDDEGLKFDIERHIQTNLNLKLDYDKTKSREICKAYMTNNCHASDCPFRHPPKGCVCKHYLRGLCKKMDHCEFLHQFNLKMMPPCQFFTSGECNNLECIFLHIDPHQNVEECAWYKRGFCKHGAACRHQHVRRVACKFFLCGFCPFGANCKDAHPRNETPQPNNVPDNFHMDITDSISEHQAPVGSYGDGNFYPEMDKSNYFAKKGLRPLESVTCFKCGAKGHYANKCINKASYHQNKNNYPLMI